MPKSETNFSPEQTPAEALKPIPEKKAALTPEEFNRQIERQTGELASYFKKYLAKHYPDFFKNEPNADETLDELIQETFRKALKSLYTFRGESSLKTWLTRIFVNSVKDHFIKKSSDLLQKKDNIRFSVNPENDPEDNLTSADPSPETALLKNERAELERQTKIKLDEAIDSLPSLQAAVFKLYLQGIKNKQIALQVGSDEGAVKNYIGRAKRRIEKMLAFKLPKNFHLRANHSKQIK